MRFPPACLFLFSERLTAHVWGRTGPWSGPYAGGVLACSQHAAGFSCCEVTSEEVASSWFLLRSSGTRSGWRPRSHAGWGGVGLGPAGAAGPPSTRLPAPGPPRSISVYKSSQGSKKVRLQHFFTPDKSTVMSLACTPQSLYAGLVNGAVAVYTKAEGKRVCTVCPSTRPLS